MILGLPVQDPDPLVRGMGPNPAPDPDPLVRGPDPGIRIRIRTKMAWIRIDPTLQSHLTSRIL